MTYNNLLNKLCVCVCVCDSVHWLFSGAEEAFFVGDDKGSILTSLASPAQPENLWLGLISVAY